MKLPRAFLLIFLTISCGQNQKENSEQQSRVFSAERETFFNGLKNPAEITNLAGLTGFNPTLLNETKNYYLYATSEVMAAANLGIYMADLNYCILFKKSEEAKKYFGVVYELSKIIHVEKGTLEFLINRYEANLAQNDSVKLIIGQLLRQSTLGLQGTDRERLAGIAMAGYQIENLHLVITTLNSFPDTLTEQQTQTKELLLNLILDQRGKFEVVYNFVRANSDPLDPDRNPNYPFFDNALRELIGVYHGVEKANPNLKELGEKVNAIRNKVVSTE
jgi:hypothetical protein